MKKLLLINPLTYIVLIGIIALCYQLFNGAQFTYSNFNEVTGVYLNIATLNIITIKEYIIPHILHLVGFLILSILLLVTAFFGGRYFWFSIIGYILGYFLLLYMRLGGWFGSAYSCSEGDFCEVRTTYYISLVSIFLFILLTLINRLWLKKYII